MIDIIFILIIILFIRLVIKLLHLKYLMRKEAERLSKLNLKYSVRDLYNNVWHKL